MRKIRRKIAILMLLVLTALTFKVFFSDIFPHGSGNEFAHIHIFKFFEKSSNVTSDTAKSVDSCDGAHDLIYAYYF